MGLGLDHPQREAHGDAGCVLPPIEQHLVEVAQRVRGRAIDARHAAPIVSPRGLRGVGAGRDEDLVEPILPCLEGGDVVLACSVVRVGVRAS